MNAIVASVMSWIVRLAVLAAVLSSVCFGILVWKVKPLAVALCPVCFGFEKAGCGVYVQHGMPVEQQTLTMRVLALADDRIRGFYGDIEFHPRVLICTTQDCIVGIGGGDAATGSVGALVLLLGPKGMNEIDITHELSLIEVAGRVGLFHSIMDTVPAWFDEGVAVVASDAPEFTALASANQNGCLTKPTDDMPADRTQWTEEASQYPFIYAQAGCRVAEWMATRGGGSAVSRLLARVANGEPFDRAYAEH
ncbi:MAG: hypothetical protein KGJ08_02885 [Gammaproteobacteria bacterium]|nr:hypothetical protein [Gammaproteobacteria bacterium]